jgi:hypothetical protein
MLVRFPFAILLFFLPLAAQDRPDPVEPRDQQQSDPGWRRFGDTPPPPAQLQIPAGTWISIRTTETLSTDSHAPGQSFTATLSQPLVVSGYVVARRGQLVAGRIADVEKAGRVKGTSRLGLELTELGLVDGQQLPITSQLISYDGGTSKSRDGAVIAATTGLGAAIGGAAAGGSAAGIGAAAGAAAATIGVLTTRGRAAVIEPEAVLTFRVLTPLNIDISRSSHAFEPVRNDDFNQRSLERRHAPNRRQPNWLGYPPVWGPNVMIIGGRGWGGPGWGGRGWGRRGGVWW